MLKRHVWKPIAAILFTLVLISVLAFFYTLVTLDVLILKYLAVAAAVLILLIVLVYLLLYLGIHKKCSRARRARRIVGVILAALVIGGCGVGTYVLSGIVRTKESVTARPTGELRSYISVFVKADDPAQKLEDLGAYDFGVMMKNEELNSRYAIAEIGRRTGASVHAIAYSGISDAAAALRDGEIGAIAVNESYLSILKEIKSLADFGDSIRLIERIGVPGTASMDALADIEIEQPEGETAPAPTPVPTPEPTPVPRKIYGEDEPLIFYLSGIDNWEETSVLMTHSDVNILMVINPKTKQVLILNTPRDAFVTNPAAGAGDKLTHCAVGGVYNSIGALEDLYQIDVNNYVRVNFEGFVRFINAIGGIDVDNPVAFQNETGSVKFVEGMNHLDGGAALVYARERHAFADGDLARNRNQVRVLNAILAKVRSNGAQILFNYNEILDFMAGSFDTDLTSSQMSDLIKIATRYLDEWDIKNHATLGASGKRVTATGGSEPLFIIWLPDYQIKFSQELLQMILNDEIITDEKLASAPGIY